MAATLDYMHASNTHQSVELLNVSTSKKQRICALLKASGDDLRLDILRALKSDSLGVLELCKVFNIKQSGMSHHLKVLAKAALVSTRREGNSIFYTRDNSAPIDELLLVKEGIYKAVDSLELSPQALQQLSEVHQTRADISQHFFNENAHKFKQQQDLIAAFDVYGSQVNDVIGASVITDMERAVEIGPGEGEFLPYLAKKFKHVTALDNSPSMLKKASAFAGNLCLENVTFELGDTTLLTQTKALFDCAVMNMVLHHTPSPSLLFKDISQGLKDGGILVLCELCKHQQEWTKQACGDLWMGFDPSDLTRWAKDNALSEKHNAYFALRNGFQIQIRVFKKNSHS